MIVRVYVYKNVRGKEKLDKVVPFISVKYAEKWLRNHGYRKSYDDVYLCYDDPKYHATMRESER